MRNKVLLLSLAYIILSFNTVAQEIKNGYVGFAFGGSIPIGEFASTELGSESSGFAKKGVYLELVKVGYKLSRSIGIVGCAFGIINPFDVKAYSSLLESRFPITAGSLKAEPWISRGLLAGPTFHLGSDKLEIIIAPMAGLINTSSPHTQFSTTSGGSNSTFYIESVSSSSIAYKISAEIRHRINNDWAVFSEINIVGTELEFKDVRIFDQNLKSIGSDSFIQPINTVNISVGLLYLLK